MLTLTLLLFVGCTPDDPKQNPGTTSPDDSDPTTGDSEPGDSDPGDSDPGDSDPGTDSDPNTDSDAPCGVTLLGTTPADGALDVVLESDLRFALSGPDPSAQIVTTIPGTQSLVGDTLVWTPSLPLEPSTSYLAELVWCGGAAQLGFTTEAGGPVLVGRSYEIDSQGGNVVSPPGVGGVLAPLISYNLMFSVLSESGGALSTLWGPGEAGVQDFCLPTFGTASATVTDLTLTVGPGDAEPTDGEYKFKVEDAILSIELSPDGGQLQNGVLTGTLDMRDAPAELGSDPQEICELLSSFGASCINCLDGERVCMPVRVEDLTGAEISTSMVEVNGLDCEGCEAGPPASGAVCETTTTGAVCSTAAVVPGWILVMLSVRGLRRRRGQAPALKPRRYPSKIQPRARV